MPIRSSQPACSMSAFFGNASSSDSSIKAHSMKLFTTFTTLSGHATLTCSSYSTSLEMRMDASSLGCRGRLGSGVISIALSITLFLVTWHVLPKRFSPLRLVFGVDDWPQKPMSSLPRTLNSLPSAERPAPCFFATPSPQSFSSLSLT